MGSRQTQEVGAAMEFGEKLRIFRKRRGFSQAELAKLAGITTRSLQYYEAGSRLPQSADTVLALALALEVEVSDLTEDTNALQPVPDSWDAYSAACTTQLDELLKTIAALMREGQVREADARAFMCAVNDIYFDSRRGDRRRHREYRLADYRDKA